MKQRSIEQIASPKKPHFVGDGFRVHNYIPSYEGLKMKRTDPFIMLDYNEKFYFPPSDITRGVGVHPHRGFETVTVAYKGKIAHHDSAGGGGIIGEGDVQWMTAAAGVLHKEYHEEEFSKNGGDFQMVQLWVNLPKAFKMTEPKYQAIKNDKMGKHFLDNNESYVEIIAGSFRGTKGPASTFSPINMMNVKIKANEKIDFSFPEDYNTLLLVLEGSINVNDSEQVNYNQLCLFKNDGEYFSFKANEDSLILVLSGEPINEPIAAHGPFVMNTWAEIDQAINDFNNGKFGTLN